MDEANETMDFLIGEVGERIRRLETTPEELAAAAIATGRNMDPNEGDAATALNIVAFYELFADALFLELEARESGGSTNDELPSL